MSDDDPKDKFLGCGCLGWACAVALLFLVLGIALGPAMPGGIRYPKQNATVQTAHGLLMALYAYSNDNEQRYPDGGSSTEVFQKLLDGGYVTDASYFYIPLPGKVKADPKAKKLKPENIGWDVTVGADEHSPERLPLVFLTGYKVAYRAGSSAVWVETKIPAKGRTWAEFLFGPSPPPEPRFVPGIAVGYIDNSCRFVSASPTGDHSIPTFVPPDFKPDGKTYRQLTPDGPLP